MKQKEKLFFKALFVFIFWLSYAAFFSELVKALGLNFYFWLLIAGFVVLSLILFIYCTKFFTFFEYPEANDLSEWNKVFE